MLTISVKNFGPIAEGSVDLKPLTIFVGPSNTGKSYMATAVYSVMRARTQDFDVRRSHRSRRANPWSLSESFLEDQISGEAFKSLEKWVSQQSAVHQEELLTPDCRPFPRMFSNELHESSVSNWIIIAGIYLTCLVTFTAVTAV